jgi:hypothetical protein
MFLSENSSPNFLNKSKSSADDKGDASNTPYDLIEHDVTGLSKTNSLPPVDSFDALQIGCDR